ncbi:basic leucine zipper 34 [Diospyros lotus]|uniref:basic leucine zipper 34 n=1 Tax=Diospyros lotus TaxID=55363 RepID=UPI0022553C98|nr:basic leucine zipper 34 [Diospyros lotus]XP_052186542.1 basic leucine zipper 34 [Diospyros lotus]XP_052186543.1 basic leucine zipper 34 [Diospyros lotus]
MSRQAHLPPRCPFQKRTPTRSIHENHDSFSPSPCKYIEAYPRHQKSISQGAILEEQPAWLDDLLSDTDTNTKVVHRRSASDSVTLLDGLISPNSSVFNEDDDNLSLSETGSSLESACTYGPNSPRRKGKLTLPENAMVSALSEYLSLKPMQCLDGDLCISGVVQCDSLQDTSGSAGEVNNEIKAAKRHSGQRSRVRKLQYIAQLEKTVDALKALESELALKVASLLQQRVALSMENSKLKQQVVRLQQDKLIVDGQYQYLQKEVKRLKIRLAYSPNSNSSDFSLSPATEGVGLDASWQMLDMGKLNLN